MGSGFAAAQRPGMTIVFLFADASRITLGLRWIAPRGSAIARAGVCMPLEVWILLAFAAAAVAAVAFVRRRLSGRRAADLHGDPETGNVYPLW